MERVKIGEKWREEEKLEERVLFENWFHQHGTNFHRICEAQTLANSLNVTVTVTEALILRPY